MGSVSGGCIEEEVVRRAREITESGEPALLDFGNGNEDAWSVGLEWYAPVCPLIPSESAFLGSSTSQDEPAVRRGPEE